MGGGVHLPVVLLLLLSLLLLLLLLLLLAVAVAAHILSIVIKLQICIIVESTSALVQPIIIVSRKRWNIKFD